MFIIAEAYATKGSVDVLLDDRLQKIGEDKLKQYLNNIFPINWTNIHFKSAPVGGSSSALKKYMFTKHYDYLFYLTDGSLFYSGAKKSFLHVQMPLPLMKVNLISSIKLSSWKGVIYNSQFTYREMKDRINLPAKVIYPPVDTGSFYTTKKKNIIANIGRFVRVKRQDVLIRGFETFIKRYPKEKWELVLMGGIAEGDQQYLGELKQMAKGLPIRICENIPRSDLIKTLSESKIYWHAMGYETDNPQEQEHFGIAVVEAMAAGCIPIVVNKGGLVEIVDNGKYGILWEKIEDLVQSTAEISKKSPFSEKVLIERSKEYSKQVFIKRYLEL